MGKRRQTSKHQHSPACSLAFLLPCCLYHDELYLQQLWYKINPPSLQSLLLRYLGTRNRTNTPCLVNTTSTCEELDWISLRSACSFNEHTDFAVHTWAMFLLAWIIITMNKAVRPKSLLNKSCQASYHSFLNFTTRTAIIGFLFICCCHCCGLDYFRGWWNLLHPLFCFVLNQVLLRHNYVHSVRDCL